MKPTTVETAMARIDMKIVLVSPTAKTRPWVMVASYGIRAVAISKPAGTSRNPKPVAMPRFSRLFKVFAMI